MLYYLTFTQYTWEWPGLSAILQKPHREVVHAFEHSWTLAIEEQFYLLWPLAIFLVGRRRVAPLVGAILVFAVWFKTLGYHSWILPNVVGAFAMGGLIAAILDDEARARRLRWPLSIGFVASGLAGLAYVVWYYTVPAPGWVMPYMAWRDSLQNFGFYAVHFGIVGFVAVNAGAWFLAPLRLKELTFLGEISYGMYLYHMPVFWFVGGYWIRQGEPWLVWAGKIGITFVVATLSYRYVERPILRLKDRFPYERVPGGPSAQPASSAIRPPWFAQARPSMTARG